MPVHPSWESSASSLPSTSSRKSSASATRCSAKSGFRPWPAKPRRCAPPSAESSPWSAQSLVNVTLYLVMRVALGIAGTIVASMRMLPIGSLIAHIPLGGVTLGLWLGAETRRHSRVNVVMIAAWVVAGSHLPGAVYHGGDPDLRHSLYTFFQAYKLYFLGGRYPLLADFLTASAPPPQTSNSAYAGGYPPPFGTPLPPA